MFVFQVSSDSGVKLDSSSQYAQYGSADGRDEGGETGTPGDGAQDSSPVSSDSVSIGKKTCIHY